MKLVKFPLSILAILAGLLTGCASIVDGSTQELVIDSYPQGATVEMNGVEVGITPVTLTVSRKDANIILKKEGYKSANVPLESGVNPWFFGNIITGGLLGSATDSSTGAINAYNPGQYVVNLEQE